MNVAPQRDPRLVVMPANTTGVLLSFDSETVCTVPVQQTGLAVQVQMTMDAFAVADYVWSVHEGNEVRLAKCRGYVTDAEHLLLSVLGVGAITLDDQSVFNTGRVGVLTPAGEVHVALLPETATRLVSEHDRR